MRKQRFIAGRGIPKGKQTTTNRYRAVSNGKPDFDIAAEAFITLVNGNWDSPLQNQKSGVGSSDTTLKHQRKTAIKSS